MSLIFQLLIISVETYFWHYETANSISSSKKKTKSICTMWWNLQSKMQHVLLFNIKRFESLDHYQRKCRYRWVLWTMGSIVYAQRAGHDVTWLMHVTHVTWLSPISDIPSDKRISIVIENTNSDDLDGKSLTNIDILREKITL